MKITHQLLQDWLQSSHLAAKAHFGITANWPRHDTPQSEWTLWAHYTFAAALVKIYPRHESAKMSLRVSRTKKDLAFWDSAAILGVVNDYTTQQQGVDFCLMGPTGSRVHFLTAESECNAKDSVSISLGEQGYIWDWKKLLGDHSEHRLLFAVVGGSPSLKIGDPGRPDIRRSTLRKNMTDFFNQRYRSEGISYPDGIGGYIISHHDKERTDCYTFIVDQGAIQFAAIPFLLV